jgi:hypothetical protein
MISSGSLQIGNWSDATLTFQIEDSTGSLFADVQAPSGGWTAIAGPATGAVYFYVNAIGSGSMANPEFNVSAF